MILRYFYDEKLAQASYMIGCAKCGEALIIDPMRNIQPYLDAAKNEGLQITHITETHIHADYVSGSRELAQATGAMMYLSEAGGADWSYSFPDARNILLLNHGDTIMVGNIRIDVLHTPGHTPEHLSFLITDTLTADRPIGIFSGDALFVGDVGRPDLLEAAVGAVGTAVVGARQQYATVQLFKTLPDYLQVWPGHGAGSACGKALGAIPSTTLGYEKLFNPAFQFSNEGEFVDWLLDGQPEPPRYFGVMKRVNRFGAALLRDLTTPIRMDRAAIDAAIEDGAFVLDVRARNAFTASHIPGTINAPMSSRKLSTYVGSLYDYAAPMILILPDESALDEMLTTLRAVGVDAIAGYATADVVGENEATLPSMSANDLALWVVTEPVYIFDVRNRSEREARHIEGSYHIPLASLPTRMHEIPKDQPVAVYCASGYRSQMAVTYLRAHGWTRVATVNDDEAHWAEALKTSSTTSSQEMQTA